MPMQQSKTIFISHASNDARIAKMFKDTLEKDFLGLCKLFVSSNLESLSAGKGWYDNIIGELKNAAMLIGLVSPAALQRGWVYFEFGAAVIRDIHAIPLCHSGLEPGLLPEPISHLQGIKLTDSVHLKHLYCLIAESLGCSVPIINFDATSQSFLEISETNRVRDMLSFWLNHLSSWNPDFSRIFANEQTLEDVMIPQHAERDFGSFIDECHTRLYLQIEMKGTAMGTSIGAIATILSVSRGVKFDEMRRLISK
jgi:TIR domain